ncbi:hypothetical protein EXN66_Car015813 [Channa argus]|uniref:Uncharacterized protein n=1 Tax=Channa argus TaxID=215402 RepID=A0A6G1QDC9_CHAAH|nr:hypothetical protein EXN66_Car015813 [Channa argus]
MTVEKGSVSIFELPVNMILNVNVDYIMVASAVCSRLTSILQAKESMCAETLQLIPPAGKVYTYDIDSPLF